MKAYCILVAVLVSVLAVFGNAKSTKSTKPVKRCCTLSSSTELTKNVELTRLQDVSGTDVYDLVAEYDGTCDAENQIVSSMYTDLVYCSTKCGDTISKGDMTDEMISAAISRSSLQCYFNEMLFEKDICDTTCEVVTEGNWVFIASGGQVVLTSSISWSETSTKTTSTEVTNSITLSGKMTFKKIPITAKYTYKNVQTVTNMYSQTNSGSSTIQSTLDCNDKVYQYVITQYGTTGPDTSLDISTFYFACVPFSSSEEPLCPPQACGNAACDCCTTSDWSDDASTVPICTSSLASELTTSTSGLTTSTSGLLTAKLV
eukprot:CFRG6036T1